jgi:cbb3-type cytochrome oxidase maturation protein
MNILAWLIPVSLTLGGVGLLAFLWTLKHGQYDDPAGDAARILQGDFDDAPKPDDQTAPDRKA